MKKHTEEWIEQQREHGRKGGLRAAERIGEQGLSDRAKKAAAARWTKPATLDEGPEQAESIIGDICEGLVEKVAHGS